VILGRYGHLIVDEAHALESTARLAFTATLSESRVERVADDLGPGRSGRRHGWFDRLSLAPDDVQWRQAVEASGHVRSLTARVVRAVGASVTDERRGPLPAPAPGTAELAALRSALHQWELAVEGTIERLRDEPELAHEGEGGLAAIRELVHVCDVLSGPMGDNVVHWYEREFGRLALHVTPLDVAPILEAKVYPGIESIVLTSATLSLGGDFEYLDESLGLSHAFDPVRTAVAESPFAYPKLMRILLPVDLPSVSADSAAYAEALAELLVLLHASLDRNGLVLFTSYDLLFDVHARIRDRIPTLAQGIDGSRTSLVERFRRERGGCVLLGTDSFWEGIDLPGEELEYVVVTRLPFAVPTDPVFAALSAELERRGRDAFVHLALPQAVLRLRQGVGRLIRTSSDRGVVVLTDDRIRTKPYGRRFAESLPVRVDVVSTSGDAAREAARWFELPGRDDGLN
jgi:Rad3-related DNA helicase